ncbi:hypothetical protein EOE67_02265 [Rheinheimera riviphila]|uniref:Uncharacterized protein n=1 Tax=Rheinheimera riviphila TaxID=1834037 RepID=A0A437R5H2_9GAMM|nr:hypothetical protein [Rheinheimera riviphila]RVU42030.1 hypothetical protein EOE67_02265 [Rheinheimera riviphila]
MKVLVTSGKGCISSHRGIALMPAGITPGNFDRLSNTSAKMLHRRQAFSGQHGEFTTESADE